MAATIAHIEDFVAEAPDVPASVPALRTLLFVAGPHGERSAAILREEAGRHGAVLTGASEEGLIVFDAPSRAIRCARAILAHQELANSRSARACTAAKSADG